MASAPSSDLPGVIVRLQRAWNEHDLDGLTACFHLDYESVNPLHPERNFRGQDGARRCWQALFAAIPDFQAEPYRHAVMGEVVWTEWRWSGSHLTGAPFMAGGVMIFGLLGDQIAWARLYTETLQIVGPDIDAVLRDVLSRAQGEG